MNNELNPSIKAESKADVSSSTFISNVPNKFAECVKKYHKDFNVQLKLYKNYRFNFKTVHVVGKMSDLELLNTKCSNEAYGNSDDVE